MRRNKRAPVGTGALTDGAKSTTEGWEGLDVRLCPGDFFGRHVTFQQHDLAAVL
jgi:hypothetical protein